MHSHMVFTFSFQFRTISGKETDGGTVKNALVKSRLQIHKVYSAEKTANNFTKIVHCNKKIY